MRTSVHNTCANNKQAFSLAVVGHHVTHKQWPETDTCFSWHTNEKICNRYNVTPFYNWDEVWCVISWTKSEKSIDRIFLVNELDESNGGLNNAGLTNALLNWLVKIYHILKVLCVSRNRVHLYKPSKLNCTNAVTSILNEKGDLEEIRQSHLYMVRNDAMFHHLEQPLLSRFIHAVSSIRSNLTTSNCSRQFKPIGQIKYKIRM